MLRYSQVDFFQVFIYKLSWNKCMIWLFGHNMNCWDIHEWLFSSIDFEFVKFRKTHSHQHAISRVLWFFKFWIWICQIHKDSLTPTCDFPGSKDFQVLNLNLSPVWKYNKNSILTLTLFLFLIWKKSIQIDWSEYEKKI